MMTDRTIVDRDGKVVSQGAFNHMMAEMDHLRALKEKQELIQRGKQWIEHAPEARGHAEGLAGWTGKISVCAVCADRMLGRGCDLKSLATNPVWEPESVECDLC